MKASYMLSEHSKHHSYIFIILDGILGYAHEWILKFHIHATESIVIKLPLYSISYFYL
jgi:hypothetical protein